MQKEIKIKIQLKDNKLDQEVMLKEYYAQCAAFTSSFIEGQTKAAEVVENCFNSSETKKVPRSAIVSLAGVALLQKSGSKDFNLIPKFEEVINTYITENCTHNPYEADKFVFGAKIGSNGGTWRWKDISEEEMIEMKTNWDSAQKRKSIKN
jgi:hypothetical protein